MAPGGQSLTFEVPQENIQQGNAIVAVRDASNTILWSWHIWVTDFVPGLDPTVENTYNPNQTQRDKVVTNYQNVQHTFMGVNLGWCDASTKYFEARKVKVVISQATTNETAEFIVSQNDYTATTRGNNTYFQWGRKDPMLRGYSTNMEICYSNSGYPFTTEPNTVTIGTAIQHPNIDYTDNTQSTLGTQWSNIIYLNMWNANNTQILHNTDPVIKTVYDPSPAGYCLPPSGVWSGFTNTGGNVTSTSDFNIDESFDVGWTFYCKPNKKGGVVYMPTIGCRPSQTGRLSGVEVSAYYWHSIPSTGVNTGCIYFSATFIQAVTHSPQGHAFAVRPIREQ